MLSVLCFSSFQKPFGMKGRQFSLSICYPVIARLTTTRAYSHICKAWLQSSSQAARSTISHTPAASVCQEQSMSVESHNQQETQERASKMAKIDVVTTLRVKRLTENAVVPTRGSSKAAGYDLSSAYEYTVPAQGKELVKTDLSIAIPSGTYARVAPRSGLAWKSFIDTGAGVIDEDYRGNVGVVLFNHGQTDFRVKRGDRVAQLILERILTPEVEEVLELDTTVRGSGGYGSTGVSR